MNISMVGDIAEFEIKRTHVSNITCGPLSTE